MKQPRHEKLLQECKEEVAKKENGGHYFNWDQFSTEAPYFEISYVLENKVLPLYVKRIAIEYAMYCGKNDITGDQKLFAYDQFLTELI